MFGTFPRLGEVAIGPFNPWILVAVPELLGQAKVPVVVMLLNFSRTLRAVGIVIGNLRHHLPQW